MKQEMKIEIAGRLNVTLWFVRKYGNESVPHRKDAKVAWFDKLTMIGLSRSP